MTAFFTAVVIFDGWIDGRLSASIADDKPVQATILGILIVIIIILAQLEFSNLAIVRAVREPPLRIFTPVSTIASILLAGTWYWPQLLMTMDDGRWMMDIPRASCLVPLIPLFVLAFTFLGLLLYQYAHYGTTAVLANCGVNCFSIIYLGLFSGFILAIRIDFGLWPLLMFIFVVKSSDIGAYAIGTLFGKHKFSPKISPAKTWEGMAAATATAMIVAFVFAASFDIMNWWSAVFFGFCFAVIAQFGDLAESMIKRDAEQKDSANKVPGYGGILDIIDSPLVAAPFAYLFFYWILDTGY
ncbi:MAG: phosphatidate cytidylyltransferase [Sedimentisphaerales bacterium]